MNPTRRYPRNSATILLVVGAKYSQMPRHLISDAHEWINEIPSVPIYFLAKPLPRASGAPREVRRASIGSVRSGVLESNSCWGHKAQHIASYASSHSSYLHVVPLECLSTPPRRIIEFETGYGEARAVRCTPMGSSDPTYP